jgi:hypothetical protein
MYVTQTVPLAAPLEASKGGVNTENVDLKLPPQASLACITPITNLPPTGQTLFFYFQDGINMVSFHTSGSVAHGMVMVMRGKTLYSSYGDHPRYIGMMVCQAWYGKYYGKQY